jgi:hypothetical protein
MARRVPPGRVNEDEQVASADVSRLIVLGFVVAGALGFLIGLVWVVWNVIRPHMFG